jgi:hypothetical protein
LQKKQLNENYKVADLSLNVSKYALSDPSLPKIEFYYQRMLNSLTPSSNRLWDVSSPGGGLALPLYRNRLVYPDLVRDEVYGKSTLPPGQRIMDYLGVRYITVNVAPETPGLRNAYFDPDTQVRILENTGARPRLQFFTRARVASNADEALDMLLQQKTPSLVIEAGEGTPEHKLFLQEALASATSIIDARAPKLSILLDTGDEYVIEVESEQPGWVFLSDANYPGWRAELDGNATPVFSAQVIGKAMYVPTGNHTLRLWFHPTSIYAGMAISAITVLLTILLLLRSHRRNAY